MNAIESKQKDKSILPSAACISLKLTFCNYKPADIKKVHNEVTGKVQFSI